MAKKFTLYGCPCCGARALWHKGNKETRMLDTVECTNCGLTIEGDYKPMSGFQLWNSRTADHYIINREVNIEGENL